MDHTKLVNTVNVKPLYTYLIKILAGSAFIAISAQIAIPFYPVPMTFQWASVLMLGLLCRPSVAFGSVALYLVEGYVGLPVFSNMNSGPLYMLGTVGGYLMGFLPLAFITSSVSRLHNTRWNKVFACTLGTFALYASGISWLSRFIGFEKALQFGLFPFLLQIPLYIGFSVVVSELAQKYENK